MKRLILTFLALVALCGVADAGRLETFYLKGFTRSGATISSVGDSIPAGTTFTSRWIPIFGARQVTIGMRAASADSDTVVTITVANVDTTGGTALTIATATTTVAPMGQGVGAYSNYAGTGGTTWGPNSARTITLLPLLGVNAANGFIPMRWMRVTVKAPTSGDNTGTTACGGSPCGIAVRSMNGVRIWVDVFRDDDGLKGNDAYYPFSGTYP